MHREDHVKNGRSLFKIDSQRGVRVNCQKKFIVEGQVFKWMFQTKHGRYKKRKWTLLKDESSRSKKFLVSKMTFTFTLKNFWTVYTSIPSDRPIWLKIPSAVVLNRLFCCKWPVADWFKIENLLLKQLYGVSHMTLDNSVQLHFRTSV